VEHSGSRESGGICLRFTWDDKSVLVLHNLAKEDCQIAPFIAQVANAQLTDLFGNRVYSAEVGASDMIELDGYGYRWFRITG